MTELRLEGITKRFGSLVANDQINLLVESGTIHGLLGENGAGKTTLMNILCGLYQPDEGKIYLQGELVQIDSPKSAIACGIAMIHQHFMLVPQLSVTENIILGTGWDWRLNLRQKGREIAQMSQSYGLEIDPHAKVGDLPVGLQQRVEILKALYRRAKLLILDEPTAVLTPSEIEAFFQILRQLAAKGRTIIFISHKLEEAIDLCDRVTVLRRGQVVATTSTENTTSRQLAQFMVGREVLSALNKSPCSPGEVVLDVTGLEVQDDRHLSALKNISFQLKAGEILGVAGIDGNRQRELADAIAGLRIPSRGRIQFQGRDITHWSVEQRVKKLPLAYIPEDRQKTGLVLRYSIAKNLILKTFRWQPFSRHGFLKHQAIQEEGNKAIASFDIRAAQSHLPVSQLSGGNQQKVVLARELSGKPKLIIAMQPTRGLDVGATEYVQQRLLAERDSGAAILYISTELEEIMAISDRIAVMHAGEFVAILDPATAGMEQIGLLMAGGVGEWGR